MVTTKKFTKNEAKFLSKIGKTIMALANQRKTSFERLAYEAEISKTYFYDVIHGRANPSVLVLKKIANVLDIPIWKLVKSTED